MKYMGYKVAIEKFEGPLDLLLQLIEKEELDITEIALSKVTEQYLSYLEKVEELFPEELSDFLVVATRLLLLKSKLLLPEIEDEEEGEEFLTEQLRLYKKYADATETIEKLWYETNTLRARPWPKKQIVEKHFQPLERCTVEDMSKLMQEVIESANPVIALPKEQMKKAISLKERITQVQSTIMKRAKLKFKDLLGEKKNRAEVVVTFLALLELVKLQTVKVDQKNAKDDIMIKRV